MKMSALKARTLGWLAVAVPMLAAPLAAAGAADLETTAKHAIILDASTGTVLFEKDAEVPIEPASMSKLMTVYLVFERLRDGRLHLDDKFTVSEKAWRKGGSKMFVRVNSRVSVRDLLQGIIVQSGNDACIVIAEGLAGSEEHFAELMTKQAHELGLLHSHFSNATGWPDEGQRMSVRDIATLSLHIIRDFPEDYKYFGEKTFTYNGIRQGNRNPLLYHDGGADGLKTGHTESAGYGLAASAVRDGRRIVLVLAGMDSMQMRASESQRLMDWAFREFDNYALFKRGEEVDKADVWLGKQAKVPLVVDRDVKITLQRRLRPKLEAKIVYTSPVPAPITKGSRIGRIVVTAPDFKTIEVPLSAGADVEALNAFGRIGAAVHYLLWGANG